MKVFDNMAFGLKCAMYPKNEELHERLKATAVYVTHDQVEAMTMEDRIVVMKDG